MPFLPLPGNHDDRNRLRSTFPDHPWVDDDHASWVQFVDGVRIVGLDTTVPGEPGGLVDDRRAAWLTSALADTHDGVTILAMHHPPFESGIGWMDRVSASGTVVASSRCCGISRTSIASGVGTSTGPITSQVAGVPAEVGLATTVHVALDLAPDVWTQVVRDPVGYRVHSIAGRRSSVTRATSTREKFRSPRSGPNRRGDCPGGVRQRRGRGSLRRRRRGSVRSR